MGEVCEDCKKWRKKQYWNALPPNKHHFLKIMVGDSFMNQLKIPRKFRNNFKGELSKRVTLKGPSGNTWSIKLLRTDDDDFILGNGWEVFAKDHNLKKGYFLVFRYVEDSTFQVMIFDPYCCEDESSYFVRPSYTAGSSSSNNKQGPKSCCSMKEAHQDTTYHADHHALNVVDDHVVSDDNEYQKESEDEDEEEYLRLLPRKDLGTGNRTDKTENLCNKITANNERRSRDLGSSNRVSLKYRAASNMIKLKASHVSKRYTLTIPIDFAVRCLPNKPQEIQLRVPPGSKTWSVQFNIWKRQNLNQYTLSAGWAKFVHENELKEDDELVLVLADKTKERKIVLLDVHIYRAVIQVLPIRSSNQAYSRS